MYSEENGNKNKMIEEMLRKVPSINLRETIRAKKTELSENLSQRVVDDVIKALRNKKILDGKQFIKLVQEHTPTLKTRKLISFILANSDLNATVDFVSELHHSEKEIVAEIVQIAQDHVTQLLEIQQILYDALEENAEIFIEELNATDEVLTKLYKASLITADKWKNLQSHGKISRAGELYSHLRHLKGIEEKLAFIDILVETNQRELARCLNPDENVKKIKEKKESAIRDLAEELKQRYKEQHQRVVCRLPSGQEIVIDFTNPHESPMELAFTAFVPRNREAAVKTNWFDGEDKYQLKDLDYLTNDQSPFMRVLFQADPGCGKTTLFRKWLCAWSSQTTTTSAVPQIYVYVPLRQVRHDRLEDIIFEDLCLLPKKFKPVFDIIVREYFSHFVFVIDGLDENRKLSEQNDLYKIIANQYGKSEVRVYASCRMYESVVSKFRPFADIAISLSGVNSSSRKEFIKKNLKYTDELVKSFLRSCYVIFDESILSIPIYLTLLCVLAKDKEQIPEKNLHHIFDHKHVTKNKVGVFDVFMEKLKESYWTYLKEHKKFSHKECEIKTEDLFHKIGRLSYDALLHSKNALSKEDFKKYGIDVEDIECLHFFVHTSDSGLYRFWHPTFEEYFAGVYYCAIVGFETSVYPLLHKREFLRKMPNTITKALYEGEPVSEDQSMPNKTTDPTQKPGTSKTMSLAEYSQFQDQMIMHEKETHSRSLRETLSPLDGCVQFACGKNSEFARRIFNFAKYACRLYSWKGEDKVKRLYDTRFECSLIFEVNESGSFGHFVDFLVSACKFRYEHWKHGQSVLANSYNSVSAKYVLSNLCPELMAKMLRELYGISCGVYEDPSSGQNVLMTEFSRSDNAALDLFLDHLPKRKLPGSIKLKGEIENLTVFKQYSERQPSFLEDFWVSKVVACDALRMFETLLRQFPKQRSLSRITLSLCALAHDHFQMLLEVVKKLPNAPSLTIIGCDTTVIPGEFYRLLNEKYPNSNSRFEMKDNRLWLDVTDIETGRSLLNIQDSFCKTLCNVAAHFTTINSFRVEQSMLMESLTEENWLKLCEILQRNSGFDELVLEDCNLTKDYHFQGIQNVLLKQQTSLKIFCFCQNDINLIQSSTWENFLDALKKCQCLKTLCLASCNLPTSFVEHLRGAIECLSALECLDVSGNQLADCIENLLLSVAKCKNITSVRMNNCILSSADIRETQLKQRAITLPNITDLNVSGNITGDISGSNMMLSMLRSKSLYSLDLSDCTLPRCPFTQSWLPDLTKLVLSGTNLGMLSEDKFCSFSNSLSQRTSLQSLDISRCGLVQTYHYRELSQCTASLRELDISHNILSSVRDDNWEQFITASDKLEMLKITKCDLQATKLVTMGKAVSKCENLKHLEVSGNDLGKASRVSWISFCEHLTKCRELVYLKLSKSKLNRPCQVEFLLKSIGQLTKLQHLNLTMSAFSQMYSLQPDVLANLKTCVNLKKLSLPQCGLRLDEQIRQLSALVSRMPHLLHLDISHNCFENLQPSTWRTFCVSLEACTYLNKLNIAQCDIAKDHHLESLGNVLCRLNSLRRLNVSENNFGDVSATVWDDFCRSLAKCSHLSKLVMRKCSISQPTHVHSLANALSHLKQLIVFEFSENTCSIHYAELQDDEEDERTAWHKLTSSIQQCELLQTIEMSRCGLDSCLSSVKEMVTSMCFLRRIDVSHNDLGTVFEDGWVQFLDSYKNAQFLQSINLGCCNLLPVHLRALGERLKQCVHLSTLNISGNDLSQLKRQDAEEFVRNIMTCTQLKSLDISSCSLTPDLFQQIAQEIPNLRCLQILNLSYNKLPTDHDELDDVLGKILGSSTHWKNLSFCECLESDISAYFLQILGRLLPTCCKRLAIFDLAQNSLCSVPEETWKDFIVNLGKCSFLTEFDMSDNGLTESQLRDFLKEHSKFPSLEVLKLHGNTIKRLEHCEEFVKILKRFPGLRLVNNRHFRMDSETK